MAENGDKIVVKNTSGIAIFASLAWVIVAIVLVLGTHDGAIAQTWDGIEAASELPMLETVIQAESGKNC